MAASLSCPVSGWWVFPNWDHFFQRGRCISREVLISHAFTALPPQTPGLVPSSLKTAQWSTVTADCLVCLHCLPSLPILLCLFLISDHNASYFLFLLPFSCFIFSLYGYMLQVWIILIDTFYPSQSFLLRIIDRTPEDMGLEQEIASCGITAHGGRGNPPTRCTASEFKPSTTLETGLTQSLGSVQASARYWIERLGSVKVAVVLKAHPNTPKSSKSGMPHLQTQEPGQNTNAPKEPKRPL